MSKQTIVDFCVWGSRNPHSKIGKSCGVNPAHVVSVEETGNAPPACRIMTILKQEFVVEGTYDNVHERLNG